MVQVRSGPLGVRLQLVFGEEPELTTQAMALTTSLGGALSLDGRRLVLGLPQELPIQRAAYPQADQLTVLRWAVEQLPEGVLITETSGRVLFANARMARVTGRDAQALIGTEAAFVLPVDASALSRAWPAVVDGGGWSSSFELDGERLQLQASSLLGAEGTVQYVLITEHTEGNAVQLGKRLAEVDRLAGEIAHQLNSPLTAISGFLEQAEDVTARRDARKALGRIDAVVGRLRELGGQEVPSSQARAQVPRRRELRRLLAVDDDPLVLRMIERALRGQHVTTCTSGAEALEKLASEDFDLVLCDLMMPGMTGMDLYERVLTEHAEVADRFLFISGGVTLPEVVAWLQTHDVALLPKPFTLDELRSAIGVLPAA